MITWQNAPVNGGSHGLRQEMATRAETAGLARNGGGLPGRFRPSRDDVPLMATRRPLDDIDQRLLDLLTADGRLSNRALAAATDVTEATVAARLRRLQDEGVLGITCVFDYAAAGYDWWAHLAFRVEGRPPRVAGKELAKLPNVAGVSVTFNDADLTAVVIAADRAAFTEVMSEQITTVKGLVDLAIDVELECLSYRWGWAGSGRHPTPVSFPHPVVELDELDHGITELLMRDGRQSNREIGRRLDVSEGTVRSHIKRLEDAGLMRIVAQIDPHAAGVAGVSAHVGFEVQGPSSRRLATWLVGRPEAAKVALTVGAHQVFAVVAANSHSDLVELITEYRAQKGVRRVHVMENIENLHHVYHWVRIL